jgi:hypothetical protein
MNRWLLWTALIGVVLTAAGCGPMRSLFGIDDRVTFYTTYGYEEEEEVVIPMRIYAQRNRRNLERLTRGINRSVTDLTSEERANFRHRMRDFLANSKSMEAVRFTFDNDPRGEEFRIHNARGRNLRTGFNGMKRGEIRLSEERVEELLEAQGSDDGWLTFRAVSSGHDGSGRVRILESDGVSIISDIDDTIKVTEIPAGASVVIRNTFYKDFTAAPGMAEMYQDLTDEYDNVFVHYVSGAPWQLFRPLNQFLTGEAGFPEGAFHMKVVRKNFLSIRTWRGLRQLITDEKVTYTQKIDQIARVFNHFPDRQFILVGDSGEMDPEVYSIIRDWFPDQVKEIYIRDVINARELDPERLEGMTVIPAPTVTRERAGEPIEPEAGYEEDYSKQ